jgi:hypothetical protein
MDDRNVEVPGAVPVERVLATDPIYRILSNGLASPWILGAAIAAIVVLAIVFGPSTDSHFIYTDF